jgi:NADPH:quinone reductase-like Zn-dependent oxidoreductase
MRAIVLSEPGAGPALTELPTPSPGAGEVLVKVVASSVNGFDTAVAAGYLTGMTEHRFPVVLGKDFAGTVAAVGEGVTEYAVGENVFGVVTKPFLRDGGFGEYVVVGDQIGLAKVPEGLDLATTGALGLAGAAAVGALDALGLQSGQTVLVSGATGGVGAIAVQYAVAAGARVIATARPGAETDFDIGLGATDVVDHTGDVSAQVRAISPGGVDAVLHLAGDGAQLASLLTDTGRLASTLGFGPDQRPGAVAIMANPDRKTLDRSAADVAEGRLRVPVERTYPLADVPAAFSDFAAGSVGKLAVTLA